MSSSRFPAGAPVAGEDRSGDCAGPTSTGSDRPIRLLVVDDDARVRTAIAQTVALEPDIIIVAQADSAGVARTLAERTELSVALVDVLLPDAPTGLALVRSLDQRQGCAVVAMSVRGGLRGPALAAGAVAFVEKGSDIDAILTAVRDAASTS